MFYNILNIYWFIKIIRKARRKILGIEKPKEKNDLSDEAHPSAKLSTISLQDLLQQQVDHTKKKTTWSSLQQKMIGSEKRKECIDSKQKKEVKSIRGVAQSVANFFVDLEEEEKKENFHKYIHRL